MKTLTKKDVATVGIIVARFQVHNLTSAHIDLINTVKSKHNKVILFLGLAPVLGTRTNPLDFESRKQMVLEKFPEITVLYIKDMPDDNEWSKKLDSQINDMFTPGQTATLYGSRDSFISHYNGTFPVIEFEPQSIISGTELRKEISSKVKASADFRAGVIWAVYNQFPQSIATVDIDICDDKNRHLMVRKPHEKLFRFVGGFCEPKSNSYEEDAKREVSEEVGVEISELEYVGSTLIKDWRYENQENKIKTTFFKCKYIYGFPKPDDDVCEAKWFEHLLENDVVEEHKVLVRMLNLKKDVITDANAFVE